MIRADNLRFKYSNQKEITLKGINFSIDRGEIYGFLGPSGAGKSTTQKVLIRLLSGFQGDVQVLHKPLKQWSNDYYNHIGVGFELPNHYTLKGIDNTANLGLFSHF